MFFIIGNNVQNSTPFGTTMPTMTSPQNLTVQSPSAYGNFPNAGQTYQHPQNNFQQKVENNFNSPFVGSVLKFMCKCTN